MTLRRLSEGLARAMDRGGYCVLFAILSGTSIGELRGGEWTNGIISALMAISIAVVWNSSRNFQTYRENMERQRKTIASVFEDICHVRDEIILRTGHERPKG